MTHVLVASAKFKGSLTAAAVGEAALEHIERLDRSGLHPRLADAEIVVACDVDNPLTGPHGAAAVYGAQKGASPDDVVALMGRWVGGPTSSRMRQALTTGRHRAPARPAGSALPRSPCSARSCVPAST